MPAYAIWVDHDHAKIFKLDSRTSHHEPIHVDRKEIKHHTAGDAGNHKNSEKFFHEVAEQLVDASDILLLGPGIGKVHFQKHLKEHSHKNLADKVVGVESMDHASDGEILNAAHKFFRTFDVSQRPLQPKGNR